MTSSICLRTLIAAFAVMANLFVSAESVKIYYGMGDGVPFSMEEVSKRNCIDVDQTSYTLDLDVDAYDWWVAFPKTWEIGYIMDFLGIDIESQFSESVDEYGLHWKVVDDYILYYCASDSRTVSSYHVLFNRIPDETDTFEGICGNNAMWKLNIGNGELRISGIGEIKDYNDLRHERYPWYQYRRHIYSVIIEDGIENVSSVSFQEYPKIENVIIGNDVKTIGTEAFRDCTSLKKITIGNSVNSIGNNAFYYCYIKRSNLVNNSKCTSPSDWGLTLCDERTEDGFCILNNVLLKYLGNSASAVIPNSVTSIGDDAFYYCSSLTSIEIPNSVESIGNYAFIGCSGLTSIEIPSSVASIGSSAFEYCSSLTSIEIPNSVESIGNYAFTGCSGLTSIEIPSSVTSIGDYAFKGCSNIEKIEWDSNVSPYCVTQYCKNNLKHVSFGNSLTSIGSFAFDGCSGLTDIDIPSSVTSIGENAFRGCNYEV